MRRLLSPVRVWSYSLFTSWYTRPWKNIQTKNFHLCPACEAIETISNNNLSSYLRSINYAISLGKTHKYYYFCERNKSKQTSLFLFKCVRCIRYRRGHFHCIEWPIGNFSRLPAVIGKKFELYLLLVFNVVV